MSAPKEPSLDDLGLGEAIDVEKLVKTLPPMEIEQERPKVRTQPKQLPPVRNTVSAAPAVGNEYPWLIAYMRWLRFAGIFGNIIFVLLAAFSILTLDLGVFVEAVFGILGCNFLFVIAALVQLAIDAKADLATIARKLK